eukprot:CAMPEP_0114622300 /NCGR_PEP_ID=MMETSP0168-20121206/9669_1 /TAXON_ID=95228 ORGANISM="Vannella sp., Strain DIVA3 517/6/12" /NCGR_SAMPLE_ID=MMETSP0168 /ASSEMBLY_ACC=CAM_ASM_000044 /LENGTH=263 /DNA_ID=CAMNT_0001833517 /DNA_START=99 /DNA_END=891 /DNA_ORIENTATION=-
MENAGRRSPAGRLRKTGHMARLRVGSLAHDVDVTHRAGGEVGGLADSGEHPGLVLAVTVHHVVDAVFQDCAEVLGLGRGGLQADDLLEESTLLRGEAVVLQMAAKKAEVVLRALLLLLEHTHAVDELLDHCEALSSTGAGTGASLGDRFRLRVRERLGLYTALRGEYRSSSSAAGGLLAVLGLVLVWRIGISGDLPCVDELEVLLETPLWRFQRIPQALQRVRAPLGPSLQQGVSAVPHSEHLLGISVSTLVVNQSNYFASGF